MLHADAVKLLALHLARVEQELAEVRRRLADPEPVKPRRLDGFPPDVRWQIGIYET